MARLNEIAMTLQNADVLGALLPLMLKVTLIAVIGRLIMAALPRASASTRYLVAVTTFLSMLLVPVVSATGFEWRLSILPPERAASASQAKAGLDTIEDNEGVSAGVVDVVASAPTVTLRDTWRGWLVLVTLAVGIALVVRMAFGIAAIAWITRRANEIEDDTTVRDFDVAAAQLGVTRFVRLLTSDKVSVPLMWGISRPVLLLPSAALKWSRDRLRVVFLHELAHLRRGDVITLLLTRATAAMYWFHPLAWSLDRAARRECEQACDDLVLTAGTRPSDYADHLLDIAKALPGRDPFGSVTLAMSRRSQLEGRLLSILQANARRGSTSRRSATAAAIAAAIVVFPIATVRLTAQPVNEKEIRLLDKVSGGISRAVVGAVTRTVSAVASQVSDTRHTEPVMQYAAASASPSPSPSPEPQRKREREYRASEDGRDYFDRARQAFSEKDWAGAVSAYKKAIEEGYRPSVAMYNMACAYARSGDTDNALEWLEKAIDNGFDDADTIIEDSDLDSIRSDRRFARITQRSNSRVDRKAREAVAQFEMLQSERSQVGDEWCEIGKTLLRLRDLPRAIAAFSEGVKLEPYHGTCWYNLACAYAVNGEQTRALDTLEQAILRNASVGAEHILEDPDLASIRGQRLEQLANLADDLELRAEREWEEEVPRYARIAQKYPNIPRAQFNYGFALLEAGQARPSIEAFTKVMNAGYRPGTAMYNIACGYAHLGDRQSAVAWLMKAHRAGMNVGEHAKGDDDLISVRDDPWVAEQIAAARTKHEEKKHYDFKKLFEEKKRRE